MDVLDDTALASMFWGYPLGTEKGNHVHKSTVYTVYSL